MTIQHAPLAPEYEKIAKIIVNAAYTVHKNLGPGLLESVYEPCFCHELSKKGAEYKRQVLVPLIYDGIQFSEALRLDVLVEDKIICELKVVEALAPVHTAQILTYLKLTEKRLGFFNQLQRANHQTRHKESHTINSNKKGRPRVFVS